MGHRGTIKVLVALLLLTGCAEQQAKLDDGKCRSYGANPGDPAYVQCRAQLDAARTVASSMPADNSSGSSPSMRLAPAPARH